MMENINIELIKPHPHNPRTDVGDVTELSDSIKSQGIMQNLTVVDNGDGTYTVVIGHRRLAAAKLAGLATVPCAIAALSDSEQQAIMLLENMQRTDLTILEQAQGMQMCLDLGITETDLKQKTGLSNKTIQSRLKLLKYDKDKVSKSLQVGATIQDFMDLEKIEKEKDKDMLLGCIGTRIYRSELNRILTQQKQSNESKKIIEKIKLFAKKIKTNDGYKYVRSYYKSSDIEMPKDSKSREYAYKKTSYGSVELYVKTDETDPKEQRKREHDQRLIQLKMEYASAYDRRVGFMKEVMKMDLSGKESGLADVIIEILISSYTYCNAPVLKEVTGKDSVNDIKKMKNKKNYLNILALTAFGNFETKEEAPCCYIQNCMYRRNPKLEQSYNMLKTLGYEMTDTECQLLDGTHKLYLNKTEG